jgi:hypothetical protein
MGMSGDKLFSLSPSTQEILTTLDDAEQLFWADLALVARRGKVSRARDATVSLAMIRALQSSLGKASKAGPVLTAGLLGQSCPTILHIVTENSPHRRLYCDYAAPRITRGYPAEIPRLSGIRRFTVATDYAQWFDLTPTQNAHASSIGHDGLR